ncbi:MAG: hypothetical protein AMS25_11485 [Gemmatimonas sp. SM23_52]|nr:MAG: hypothetical protein AMS25_11485 [Gemmatimonas sp. SM23_52]
MVVDTAKLVKDTVYEGASDVSTEGMSVEAFNDERDTLRVLKVTYFGERGKGMDIYYLLSPEDYVVEHIEQYYKEPYPAEAEVVSLFKQYFYVCGGKLVDFRYQERASRVQEYLREFWTGYRGR